MPITTKDGTPLWKKQYAQQKRYDDANTVRTTFKFNKKYDADILDALEASGNKLGFVKKAIRFYLANGQTSKE